MFSAVLKKTNKILHCLLFFASASLLLSVPLHAAEGNTASYTLTKQYGSVLFRVMHQEYLNMVGRFDDFSGTLYMDFDNMANSRLDAAVNMASLNMADSDVVETLVNSSIWFNASLYPQATFRTREVIQTGNNAIDFVGDLNFVGVSMPWTLHVILHGGSDGELTGSTIGMTARGRINRTDFGLDQYMNLADENVSIEVNVKFNRD